MTGMLARVSNAMKSLGCVQLAGWPAGIGSLHHVSAMCSAHGVLPLIGPCATASWQVCFFVMMHSTNCQIGGSLLFSWWVISM